MDPNLQNENCFHIFKKNISRFIRSTLNNFFKCQNPKGIKLVTRLCISLSHLREHKFKRSFQDSSNPICRHGTDVDYVSLIVYTFFFLHSPQFKNEGCVLLHTVQSIESKSLDYSDLHIINILLFDNAS